MQCYVAVVKHVSVDVIITILGMIADVARN